MKKRIVKYTDKPIGKIRIVDDFLPRPKDLVLKEETAKITRTLREALGMGPGEGASSSPLMG